MINKKVLNIFVSILFIILLILILNKDNKNSTNISNINNSKLNVKFIEKCSFDHKEDGWVYFICLYYDKNDNSHSIKNATFDGVNIKYLQLDDHYIPVLDNNGIEVERVPASHVTLSNGISTRDDVKKVNLFLENNVFNRDINLTDLNEISLETIDKNEIISLYNSALKKQAMDIGPYMSMNYSSSYSEKVDNNYYIQLTYVMEYGNIAIVNIDILKDNIYLSSLVSQNTASLNQKKLFDLLKEIEKEIVNNNSFNIDLSDYSDDKVFNKLYELLKKIEGNN